MSDGEPRPKGLNYSKEEVASHYFSAAYLARGDRDILAGRIDELVSHREEYIRLATSSRKEEKDEASKMRGELGFQKLNLWRATNVLNFLEGEKCAPGSEFLAYAWLQERNEDLRYRLKFHMSSGQPDEQEVRIINKSMVPVSSCIVDMEKRFPAGVPTFKATESFLKALPDFVQGAVNVAERTVNVVKGNR